MIGYLEGTIQQPTQSSVIVNVQGVGYIVYCPNSVTTPAIAGEDISLCIHTVVREQNLDLYGFADKQEKEIFELLITISGIGPKVAMGILNASTVANLVQAVQSKDSSVLTKVSGIGKKNAEKIILELQNKIGNDWNANGAPIDHDDLEVFEALEALGYRSRDIQNALSDSAIRTLPGKDKIRAIMRHLS